jgi:hypothetical protein
MLAALHARIRASGKKPRLTEAILEERRTWFDGASLQVPRLHGMRCR